MHFISHSNPSRTRRLVSATLAALAIGSSPLIASARSAPAFMGVPLNAGDQACLVIDNGGTSVDSPFDHLQAGGMRNSCARTISWLMPFTIDSSGSTGAWVGARAVTTSTGAVNTVKCRSFSAAWDGTSLVFGARGVAGDPTRPEQVVTGTGLHGFGSSWMRCDMMPSTQLFAYTY